MALPLVLTFVVDDGRDNHGPCQFEHYLNQRRCFGMKMRRRRSKMMMMMVTKMIMTMMTMVVVRITMMMMMMVMPI